MTAKERDWADESNGRRVSVRLQVGSSFNTRVFMGFAQEDEDLREQDLEGQEREGPAAHCARRSRSGAYDQCDVELGSVEELGGACICKSTSLAVIKPRYAEIILTCLSCGGFQISISS